MAAGDAQSTKQVSQPKFLIITSQKEVDQIVHEHSDLLYVFGLANAA